MAKAPQPEEAGADSTRTRPVRRKRRGGFGTVVLLAVLVAAALAFWQPAGEFISSFFANPESIEERIRTAVHGTPSPSPASARARPGPAASSPGENGIARIPERALPGGISPPATPPTADRELETIFQSAAQKITEGDFVTALGSLRGAGNLEVSPRLARQRDERIEKLALLVEVDDRNPPDPESAAKRLYQFELKNGETFRGVVKTETVEIVTVTQNGGITVTVPRREIAKQALITPEERTKELRAELAARQEKTEKTGAALWRLACFALRSGLRAEAAQILMEAWTVDPHLPATIQEARAQEVLREWVAAKAREIPHRIEKAYGRLSTEFPESRAFAQVQGMLEEEKRLAVDTAREVERRQSEDAGVEALQNEAELAGAHRPPASLGVPEEPKPSAAGPFAPGDTLTQQADRAFNRGMQLFGDGSIHEDPDAGREMIQRALDELRAAIRLYNQLLDEAPGNTVYRKRLEEAERKLFWAGKFRRLS